jgi:tetratricopeptide (TPR) repeat protein
MKKLFVLIALFTLIALPVYAQQTPTEEPLPNCPTFEGESAQVRASYYMGEGLGYLNSNQLSSAHFSFTCIIRVVDPNYVPAYMQRALVRTRQRNYEGAIEDYTRAIDLDSSLLPAYNNRGIAYAAILDYENAAADFDQVIALDPNYVRGYHNRSVLYGIEGDYEAAIALLEQALSISGIDDVYAQLTDPNRPSNAPEIEYDLVDAHTYALIGLMYSAQSLENFDRYLFLSRGVADPRIESAAGALSSRFTFETRLDDGTWMLFADYSPTGE